MRIAVAGKRFARSTRRRADRLSAVGAGYDGSAACALRQAHHMLSFMPPLDAPHTDVSTIPTLAADVRRTFETGRTRPIAWRRLQLQRVLALVTERESEILDALAADFGKPRFESWATEAGFVAADVKHTLSQLAKWMRPERAKTNLANLPGKSRVLREPLGSVLIIAPWNYPIQLLLSPLTAALAAGNCAVLKPSELTPACAALMAKLIPEYLDREAVRVVEGGIDETTALLRERWDHIFFTGGGAVGRIVMEAAAKHLTPVTLELGGKSPCIVDADVDLVTAARRIVWAKFVNAGQTCVAPDYLLVHRSVQSALLAEMKKVTADFYGDDPQKSPDFARIVSTRHHARLVALLGDGEAFMGGQHDAATRYLAPTILTNVKLDAKLMTDEIFGPILPVVPVDSVAEAISFVRAREKPLALYIYSRDHSAVDDVLARTSSGGVCVNDCMMHLAVSDLPFGGVGPSGMGAYHGKAGFDCFSHRKAVLDKSTLVDPALRYPPYTADKEKWARRLL